jgi:hypothetical protein
MIPPHSETATRMSNIKDVNLLRLVVFVLHISACLKDSTLYLRNRFIEPLLQLERTADGDLLAIVEIDVCQVGVRLRLYGTVVLSCSNLDDSWGRLEAIEIADAKGRQEW